MFQLDKTINYIIGTLWNLITPLELFNGFLTPLQLEKLFMDLGMTSTTFIKQSDDFPSMQNLSKLYYFREDQLHIFNSELLK
jgi:hypothetical protein